MSAVEFVIPVVSVCIGWLIGDAIMKAIFREKKTSINGIQPDGDVKDIVFVVTEVKKIYLGNYLAEYTTETRFYADKRQRQKDFKCVKVVFYAKEGTYNVGDTLTIPTSPERKTKQ